VGKKLVFSVICYSCGVPSDSQQGSIRFLPFFAERKGHVTKNKQLLVFGEFTEILSSQFMWFVAISVYNLLLKLSCV